MLYARLHCRTPLATGHETIVQSLEAVAVLGYCEGNLMTIWDPAGMTKGVLPSP